jgi:uncharacterized protein (UPF0332 family)
MKKTNFFAKLHGEGKLDIVEPSDTMQEAYIQRANESISSSKVLLNIGNLKDAVVLSYYAMYHSLLALYYRVGIKCENHAAAIILLKEVFEIDNTIISIAKSERVDKQYYVDFDVNKEEVNDSIKNAEVFMSDMVDFIEKLNEDKIRKFNRRANILIKGN